MNGFTREEAEAKVGKQVRLNVQLPSMPAGSRGQVVMFDDLMMSIHGCTVCVEWDVGDSGSRPGFWFTKGQYDRLLQEEVS